MARRRWNELTDAEKTAILVAASVQISLAATAWIDLARRPAAQVRGPKPLWSVAIAVNFVGPISYFAVGRRRTA
jgi:Phospholipase_D-nuclease N-terminal